MPGPGFEPGLLRPQRSVLTTRRSRLTNPPTDGWKEKKYFSYIKQSILDIIRRL